MAIEKVKTKQLEWTPQSLIQVAVAGVLVVISLILGYASFRKFMLKRSFANALEFYDSGRIGNAVPALEEALGWNPEHHVARELLAKIKTEAGDLPKAEEEYKALYQGEYPRKETVCVGLGVIELKRADQEFKERDAAAEWKAAEPHVKQALVWFQEAKKANPQIPEAEIGRWHCELMSVRRAPGGIDPARARAVADGLEKVLKILTGGAEAGKAVTREGLVDLYAGLGWCNAVQGGYSESAAKYFKACYQYAPKWVLPRINMIYIDAQRFAEGNFSHADLKGMENLIRRERNEIQTLWRTQAAVYGALEEPWFQYCLATAYAFGIRKDISTYNNLAHGLTTDQKLGTRMEPHFLSAAIQYRFATEKDLDPVSRNMYMDQLYGVLDKFRQNEQLQKNTAVRAAVLHNLGFAKEWQGAWNKRAVEYEAAITQWKEAAKLVDCYETNRNLAVLYKRNNKQVEAQEFYVKAQKFIPDLKDARLQEDAANFKEFMERK